MTDDDETLIARLALRHSVSADAVRAVLASSPLGRRQHGPIQPR
jgi:hypothetical protein